MKSRFRHIFLISTLAGMILALVLLVAPAQAHSVVSIYRMVRR